MMRNCRKTLLISSQFLHCYATSTPFSSSFSSHSLLLQSPTSISSPIPNPNDLNSIPNSKTHQNPNFLHQSFVTDVLVSIKEQPLCALKFYNWAENQPGFDPNVESFCVLFHILVGSGKKMMKFHRSSFQKSFSNLQYSDATVVTRCVIDTAERLGFQLNSYVFNCLLNCFVFSDRILDAVVCFNWILENSTIDLGEKFGHYVLLGLCKRNQFETAEGMCNKLLEKPGFVGSKAVYVMMKECMRQGKVKEAEECFIKARERGVVLKAELYSSAVGAVCRKPDSSNAAFELLMEMRGKGLVPSTFAFVEAIKVCVREGKMKEALMVKDEMISCGKPMILTVITRLIKGYCMTGDLESALNLFESLSEYKLSPDEVTFRELIEGCCWRGNVEKAGELYDQMVEKGIQPNLYTSVLMIRKFLNSQRLEKALEQQFTEPGVISNENGVGDDGSRFRLSTLTSTVLIDELFKKEEVDEALKVFDKMRSKNIACNTFTYNTIIRGFCTLGLTSRAKSMLEKFLEEKSFKPSSNTYKFILERLIEEGAIDCAWSIYSQLDKKGVSLDGTTCTMLVTGLCKSGNLDRALYVRKMMVKNGLELHVSAYEALIDGLRKRKDMQNAYIVFSELLDAGLTPRRKIYQAMIAGSRDLAKPNPKPKPKPKPLANKKKKHNNTENTSANQGE